MSQNEPFYSNLIDGKGYLNRKSIKMQTPLSRKVVQPLKHIEVYRSERECKNNVLSISVKPQLSGTCETILYYTWNCAGFSDAPVNFQV